MVAICISVASSPIVSSTTTAARGSRSTWRVLRVTVSNPRRLASATTSEDRSGCLGASNNSASLSRWRRPAKASSTVDSSPGCVLAATMTVRPTVIRNARITLRRIQDAPVAGTGSVSNFRFPVTMTRSSGRPRSISRRPASSLCAQHSDRFANTRRKNGRTSRYRGYERSETRPLISTVQTPRRAHWASRFGQSSVSTITKRAGRTCSSTLFTTGARSTGK